MRICWRKIEGDSEPQRRQGRVVAVEVGSAMVSVVMVDLLCGGLGLGEHQVCPCIDDLVGRDAGDAFGGLKNASIAAAGAGHGVVEDDGAARDGPGEKSAGVSAAGEDDGGDVLCEGDVGEAGVYAEKAVEAGDEG